jgi:hypothetical protein
MGVPLNLDLLQTDLDQQLVGYGRNASSAEHYNNASSTPAG